MPAEEANCRVLVTARAFWVSGSDALRTLEQAGCDVRMSPEAGPLAEDDLIPLLQGCSAVIASSDVYNARVFEASPELAVVSRCGVGIDSVDLAAATEWGVIVTNTPGAMTDAVADYTFALLLGISRRIADGHALMRSGGWGEYPGVLVYGKTLGLIGFGNIGQGVARRASGFNMLVLAYDPVYGENPHPDFPNVEMVSLESLLAKSDFVSVHAPSMPETYHLMNADRLARMKSTAYLINTARGPLIDEAALALALESGQIAGAALDVYEKEPLPADHPLRSAPRCLLTPHNAFNAAEAAAAMSRISVENILALHAGEHPGAVCNHAVWDSPRLRLRSTLNA